MLFEFTHIVYAYKKQNVLFGVSNFHVICLIDIIISFTILIFIFRSCDSLNLNRFIF